jgi:hypothetical protein
MTSTLAHMRVLPSLKITPVLPHGRCPDLVPGNEVVAFGNAIIITFVAGLLTYKTDEFRPSFLGQCLGLSCFLTQGSVVVSRLQQWVPAGIIWPAATMLLTTMLLFLPSSLCSMLIWGLVIVGITGGVWHVARFVTIPKYSIPVVAAIALIGTLCVHQGWLIRNPIVTWGWASHRDLTFPDPNFQAAISACIRSYGVPSVGLNGVQYIAYHHASNFIVAGLSRGLGVNCLIATHVAFPVIFLPVFFWQLMRAVFAFRQWLGWGGGLVLPARMLVGWCICFIGFAGWLPEQVSGQFLLSNNILVAESLFLAVAVLCASTEMVMPIAKGEWSYRVAVCVVLVTSALLMWIKTPVAHIGAGLFVGLAGLNAFKWKRRWHFLAGASLATVLLTGQVTLAAGGGSKYLWLAPFGFLRSQVDWSCWGWYYPVVGMFAIIYWVQRGYSLPAEQAESAKTSNFQDRMFVLGLFCLGVLPGVVLGGPHAFNAFQYVYSAIAIAVVPLAAVSIGHSTHMQSKFGFGLLSSMLLASAVYSGAVNCLQDLGEIGRRNTQDRGSAAAIPLGIDSMDGKPSLRDFLVTREFGQFTGYLGRNSVETLSLLNRPGGVWNELRTLSLLSDDEKRHSLLHIRRSVKQFWDSVPESDSKFPQSLFLGFTAVGMTGIALLDGGPADDLSDGRALYFFAEYTPAKIQSDATDEELLKLAGEQGFQRVLVMEEDAGGVVRTRSVGRLPTP